MEIGPHAKYAMAKLIALVRSNHEGKTPLSKGHAGSEEERKQTKRRTAPHGQGRDGIPDPIAGLLGVTRVTFCDSVR